MGKASRKKRLKRLMATAAGVPFEERTKMKKILRALRKQKYNTPKGKLDYKTK